MLYSRVFGSLLATVALLAAGVAHGAAGIEAIPDQVIPSGKTLAVPIAATDPTGPARSYTVSAGSCTTDGSSTNSAGIMAAIRTGDPHLILDVSYTDSNSVLRNGGMEFQLLREFAPNTTQIIGGLTQGGFYRPQSAGAAGVKYITFHRVLPGFVIKVIPAGVPWLSQKTQNRIRRAVYLELISAVPAGLAQPPDGLCRG
jgi:hypothetical protein